MQYPIYQEVFEVYIWEIGDKFYNFGILYDVAQGKKELIQIREISIMEVE